MADEVMRAKWAWMMFMITGTMSGLMVSSPSARTKANQSAREELGLSTAKGPDEGQPCAKKKVIEPYSTCNYNYCICVQRSQRLVAWMAVGTELGRVQFAARGR